MIELSLSSRRPVGRGVALQVSVTAPAGAGITTPTPRRAADGRDAGATVIRGGARNPGARSDGLPTPKVRLSGAYMYGDLWPGVRGGDHPCPVCPQVVTDGERMIGLRITSESAVDEGLRRLITALIWPGVPRAVGRTAKPALRPCRAASRRFPACRPCGTIVKSHHPLVIFDRSNHVWS